MMVRELPVARMSLRPSNSALPKPVEWQDLPISHQQIEFIRALHLMRDSCGLSFDVSANGKRLRVDTRHSYPVRIRYFAKQGTSGLIESIRMQANSKTGEPIRVGLPVVIDGYSPDSCHSTDAILETFRQIAASDSVITLPSIYNKPESEHPADLIERIHASGIERKLRMADIGKVNQPGTGKRYNKSVIEADVLRCFRNCYPSLIDPEIRYDSFIVLGKDRAYDLGSFKMMYGLREMHALVPSGNDLRSLKAHEAVLTERIPESARLKISLQKQKMLRRMEADDLIDTFPEFEGLSAGERSELVKLILYRDYLEREYLRPLYDENRSPFHLYELNKADPIGIVQHVLPDKGCVLLYCINAGLPSRIFDAMMSCDYKHDLLKGASENLATVQDLAVHFTGKCAEKELTTLSSGWDDAQAWYTKVKEHL